MSVNIGKASTCPRETKTLERRKRGSRHCCISFRGGYGWWSLFRRQKNAWSFVSFLSQLIPLTHDHKREIIIKGRWLAKLVAHLLATAAFQVRIHTSIKNTKLATSAKELPKHTVARKKKNYKRIEYVLKAYR
jgi:hypothetical protein